MRTGRVTTLTMGEGSRQDERRHVVATRNRRYGRVAAVLTAAGVAVAGCAAQPGAAAVIDGQVLSETYLADAVSDYEALLGQPIPAGDMLSTLLVIPTLLEVGAEQGIGASREEAVELLDLQAEQTGVAPPTDGYADGLVDVAQLQLVNGQLGQAPEGATVMDELWQRIAAADIEVSPRYGSFELEPGAGGAIVPPSFPWLAETEPVQDDPLS